MARMKDLVINMMNAEDWEREAMKDQIFHMEYEAEMEKEYYLWLQKYQSHDNHTEDKAVVREGFGHEFIFDAPSDTQSDTSVTIIAESKSNELVIDSGKEGTDSERG